jgi:protein-S-isoprenylcysteine O-methyltransferase Ste14
VTQSDPVVRLGGWLFKHRTSLPIPLALALLIVPAGDAPSAVPAASGMALVAAGESLRFWGVGHIGSISRTRSERLGPLVRTGPFAFVRNPLYLGNIGIWAGFAVAARLHWLAPVIVLVLALEYHAVVRWEEQLLAGRFGEPYREYAARVPRWLPRVPARRDARRAGDSPVRFSWRDAAYSERGTLIAVAVGFGLLYLKERVGW